jgi:hypothetical protein
MYTFAAIYCIAIVLSLTAGFDSTLTSQSSVHDVSLIDLLVGKAVGSDELVTRFIVLWMLRKS